MDFSGPSQADYANVRSLNSTFLAMLRASVSGAALRHQLPDRVRQQVVALTDLQIERLARCPFLLMSLRERDTGYWQGVFADERTGDLWAQPSGDAAERLVTAALAFLWQLGRRNPYAVRLIAGASAGFCEQLTGAELVELLEAAAGRGELLVPRFAGEVEPWSKLLGPGISSRPANRAAAQLSVLQAMLTGTLGPATPHLRAAACASAVPVLGIADRRPGRHRE